MVGGVRMLDGRPGGVLPLESGMPGSGLPGDAGMPMYLRARSSMPATHACSHAVCRKDKPSTEPYLDTSRHNRQTVTLWTIRCGVIFIRDYVSK